VPGTTPGLIEPDGQPPQPDKNMFNLVLRDKDLMVKDAAMRKPAPNLVFGVEITPAPTLYWMTNPTCMISCATQKLVEIDFMIPTAPKDNFDIAYLLLELPPDAAHRVADERKVRDVVTTFEVARLDWAMSFKQMGFRIEEKFNVGRHSIAIPTDVPDFQPGHNVWYLSFCNDFCGNRYNESVMLTFPYAGFEHTDESPIRPDDMSSAWSGLLLAVVFSF